MEIRQLEYFHEIAATGSINEAARRLNMSQPPLSYQIKQLEAELKVKLFERTRAGVTLTEAGKLLLHVFWQLVFALCIQPLHQRLDRVRVLAEVKEQALQVAGNQDVHGRGVGQDKLSLAVVGAGLEKVIQDFIVVRCTDEGFDRHAHLFCQVCSQDIAEVSGRNSHIDEITVLDFSVLHQLGVSVTTCGTRRPMLMEFAEESWKPFAASFAANSLSPKIFFTPVCASSKLP